MCFQMISLNADIRPALRYVRLNISETQSNLNGTLNNFVAGNDTIDTSMQGRFASEEKGKSNEKKSSLHFRWQNYLRWKGRKGGVSNNYYMYCTAATCYSGIHRSP